MFRRRKSQRKKKRQNPTFALIYVIISNEPLNVTITDLILTECDFWWQRTIFSHLHKNLPKKSLYFNQKIHFKSYFNIYFKKICEKRDFQTCSNTFEHVVIMVYNFNVEISFIFSCQNLFLMQKF